MKEWDVYINGWYVGTVYETNEENARCAAIYKFDIPSDADFSVKQR